MEGEGRLPLPGFPFTRMENVTVNDHEPTDCLNGKRDAEPALAQGPPAAPTPAPLPASPPLPAPVATFSIADLQAALHSLAAQGQPRRPRRKRGASPEPYRVTITRYHMPDGNRCAARAPGSVKTTTKSETWYADLPGPDGSRVCTSLKTKDERAAWLRLRAILQARAMRELGVPVEEANQGARPLPELVAEWLAELAGNGTTAKQIAQQGRRVNRLIELAGWKYLWEIKRSSCQSALAIVQAQRARGMPAGYVGCSARTRNSYLSALKQFARWCCDTGRLDRSPVASLKKLRVEHDLRHQRRVPSKAELESLFAYLRRPDAPDRQKLPARCRALAYQVALVGGLRANEVRSLTRQSFDLEAGTLTVQAAYSKHRRADVFELPPWLAQELRDHFAAGGRDWSGLGDQAVGRIFRADLAAAGIARVVQGPAGAMHLDFHSLRYWFCSQVANSPGISPRCMLELTRHSTAELTLKVYARAQKDEVRRIVNQLPRPGGGGDGQAARPA